MEDRPGIAGFLGYGLDEEALVLTRDFEVVCVNDCFLSHYGLGEKDVVGRHCYEILPNCKNTCGDPSRQCPLREAVLSHTKVSVTQLDAFPGREDERQHFRIEVYPVNPPGAGAPHYLLINRDITGQVEEERTREEMWMAILGRMEQLFTSIIGEGEKVERSLREINHLIEILPVALVRWDLRSNIVQWNPTAEVLFGWSEKEISGTPFKSFFASGPSQDNLERIMQEILRGRTMAYSLADNRTAAGRIITCDWHHAAAPGKNGEVVGGISMANEVTEHLATLASLDKTNDLLHSILDAMGEAIIAVTPLGRVSLWNAAAENLFGWKSVDIIGREPELLLPEEKRDAFRQRLRDLFAGEDIRFQDVFEETMIDRDGKQFPVDLALRITTIGDKPLIIVVVKDITGKKLLEKNLFATEKLRGLGEMAGGVAHAFNNILSVILGNTQLLKDEVRSDKERSLLDEIEEATGKGADASALIINALQTQFRERRDDDFVLTDLSDALNDVLDFTRYRWQEQPQREGVTIAVTTDFVEAPPVLLNAPAFREMLTNIIFNAVDAMPKGGNMHLSTSLGEKEVLLSIEDNGLGINPDEIYHVFSPFFSTKGMSNSGMGLTIAQSIAASHGAEIKVRSIKGGGSVFTIGFPLLASCPYPEKAIQGKGPPLKILVIDDNRQILTLLRHVLLKNGHSVETASKGREGVRLFRKKDFDLVITDLGMPDMNGLDAAVHIKKSKAAIPIILITGWGADLDRNRPQAGLVDAVVSKPFDIEKLLETVAGFGNRAADFSSPRRAEE